MKDLIDAKKLHREHLEALYTQYNELNKRRQRLAEEVEALNQEAVSRQQTERRKQQEQPLGKSGVATPQPQGEKSGSAANSAVSGAAPGGQSELTEEQIVEKLTDLLSFSTRKSSVNKSK